MKDIDLSLSVDVFKKTIGSDIKSTEPMGDMSNEEFGKELSKIFGKKVVVTNEWIDKGIKVIKNDESKDKE